VRQGERQATMVAVVVIAPNGRVLALHRGPSTQWMPGKWDLPGGKTNGVPARKAALQILRKETGIVAKPSRLRACSAVYHPSAGTSVFYAYKLSSKDKKPLVQIAKKEHQGWRWVGPQTLRKAYQTAPYVDIAFRACFKPRSLKTYTKKGWKGTPAKPRYISLDTNAEQARLASTPSIADKIFAQPNNTNSDYKSIANLGGYGAFTMPLALQKEYYGLPLWGLLAAGGAAYYFYAKK
jgi:8-oxo-dGTP pyrophosphatase MutT (NUDIX family)